MWQVGTYKEALWRTGDGGNICTAQELRQKLLQLERGIVLLDGYSGAGKTTLLAQLQQETARGCVRMNCEQVRDMLLARVKASETFSLNEGGETVVILEDMDFLRGEATLEEIGRAALRAEEDGAVVIITGYQLRGRIPVLTRICQRAAWTEYYTAIPTEETEKRKQEE